MRLTLRKASALIFVIEGQIKDPQNSPLLVSAVSLGRFLPSYKEVVDKARKAFADSVTNHVQLIGILYNLRTKVNVANASCGIGMVLTEKAKVDSEIAFWKELSKLSNLDPGDEVIEKQLADLSNQEGPSHYKKETVSVSVVPAQFGVDVKKTLLTLQRQKQAISDKLLDLNVRNHIDLDPNEVEMLTSLGLI